MQIMPAVLVHNKQELEEQLQKLLPHFSYLQFDIADGILVEEKTLDTDQIINSLNNLDQELKIDFDLMVKDFQSVLEKIDRLDSNNKLNGVFLRPDTVSKKELVGLNNAGKIVGIAIDPPRCCRNYSE